jgi:ATP/maltotriose-dependent transcriptional regulator MalT
VRKLKITQRGEKKRFLSSYFYITIMSKMNNQFSSTEIEVYNLLCQGLSNEEIANARNVSVNTIKTQLKNIYSKLNVKNRTAAVSKKL